MNKCEHWVASKVHKEQQKGAELILSNNNIYH